LTTFVGKIDGSYADLHIFVSGNVAYGYNIQTWKFTQSDQSGYTIVESVTQIYRKIDGHWLIVHEHASIPVDLGTGKAVLESR
jgi:ketosteroid isomerase-like protein